MIPLPAYKNIIIVMTCTDCIHPIGLQMTPLHLAAERGHAEIISLLIDAGAKLEAKDFYDVSACMGSNSGMI